MATSSRWTLDWDTKHQKGQANGSWWIINNADRVWSDLEVGPRADWEIQSWGGGEDLPDRPKNGEWLLGLVRESKGNECHPEEHAHCYEQSIAVQRVGEDRAGHAAAWDSANEHKLSEFLNGWRWFMIKDLALTYQFLAILIKSYNRLSLSSIFASSPRPTLSYYTYSATTDDFRGTGLFSLFTAVTFTGWERC